MNFQEIRAAQTGADMDAFHVDAPDEPAGKARRRSQANLSVVDHRGPVHAAAPDPARAQHLAWAALKQGDVPAAKRLTKGLGRGRGSLPEGGDRAGVRRQGRLPALRGRLRRGAQRAVQPHRHRGAGPHRRGGRRWRAGWSSDPTARAAKAPASCRPTSTTPTASPRPPRWARSSTPPIRRARRRPPSRWRAAGRRPATSTTPSSGSSARPTTGSGPRRSSTASPTSRRSRADPRWPLLRAAGMSPA